MDIEQVRSLLSDVATAAPLLLSWGVMDARRAHTCLLDIAKQGVSLDLIAVICRQLREYLPRCADPDMALTNLSRFFARVRSPLGMAALFERDSSALPILLQIFSTSQYLSDLIVRDPDSYDLLRMTGGKPAPRQALVDELTAEVRTAKHEDAVYQALRRFKQREMLRIAYGDIVESQPIRVVTQQISYVADALIEAAYQAARAKLVEKRGVPRDREGNPARFFVIAMGKLGGLELNYSSDIDLILVYDGEGYTDGRRPISNAEFYTLLAREMIALLSKPTELGAPYRVDMRLRPEGSRGPLVTSKDAALRYYDFRGRTWERQAFIKARVAAGDLEAGNAFLRSLEEWIYRKYLSRDDISGIRALRRWIDKRAREKGAEVRDVKGGWGGIRDVEFVVQFLQLLHGGHLPEIRTGNTLEAIRRLEQTGCLQHEESFRLAQSYEFLRRVEHRLQIMFDLQTHLVPTDRAEVRKLALRMGYLDQPDKAAETQFEIDYGRHTTNNRTVMEHVLHSSFEDEGETAEEIDLVLHPEPDPEWIERVLSRHGFRKPAEAYKNLVALGEERIPFLSTRRCRQFLATIAPRLLAAIAETPDPDATLVNLGMVSDSLGGKGLLWELFSTNPATLELYVELCAYSPFLSNLLTSNPGMIDSLMDSLVLNKLPSREFLDRTLAELCRGAEEIEGILHAFKNDQMLRIGVRDLLRKETIRDVTDALSAVAETCLREIAAREYRALALKLGQPVANSGKRQGKPAEMAILALGKLGGAELNYHSDLDIVFVYDEEGETVPVLEGGYGRRQAGTTNQHFFAELGQRIIRTISRLGPQGRLYEVDARLRPTGKSGPLAVSLAEFARYYREGDAWLWERQALCRARVVVGSPRLTKQLNTVVGKSAFDHPWKPEFAEEIGKMRRRMEETSAGIDLKRGPGGLVDIEFLVQMLQLRHGRRNAAIRHPNTLEALHRLHEAGYLSDDDFRLCEEGYCFLRTLEGALRLTSTTARDRLPDDEIEMARLVHLMRMPSREALLERYETVSRSIRDCFDRYTADLIAGK